MGKFILILFVFSALPVSWANAQAEKLVGNLKCEYLVNPVGIDAQKPRFTWQMHSTESGATQKAWYLLVGTDSAQVTKGRVIFGNQV